MALIQAGSINDFSIAVKKEVLESKPALRGVTNVSEMKETTATAAPHSFEWSVSREDRGVGIKNIKLTEGFEGFLDNIFNSVNEIYFIAWAWDLSGQPVNLYPGGDTEAEQVLIPLKVGNVREFIGEGINLFPKRSVSGGIAIRIQIWESDEDIRNAGRILKNTAAAIRDSKLNQVLSLIAAGTGVTGATVSLVKDAAVELADIIGTILSGNANDYVDFFEGYYAADQSWNPGPDSYSGNASVISLNKY